LSGKARRNPATVTPQSKISLGVLFTVLAVGCTAAVDSVSKYFTKDLHAVVLVWGYFVAIFLQVVIIGLATRQPMATLATNHRGLHFARAGFLVLAIAFLFVGLTTMQVADAVAISFTTSSFVVVLSATILGERVGPRRWFAVGAGLIGVLVIVRPGGGLFQWASLAVVLSAFFMGCFHIATRKLIATNSTATMLFYTAAFGLVWSSLLVPFFWATPTVLHWSIFLSTGFFGVAAHFCFIKASEMAEASLLAPFIYAKLIWGILFGFLLFGQLPNFNTLAGCTLIIAAGLYVFYRERQAVMPT